MKRAHWVVVGLAVGLVSGYLARFQLRALVTPVRVAVLGPATVEERTAEHGARARARLEPAFQSAGLAYPPRSLVLAGFKNERELQLYAADASGAPRFIRAYPVLAASGALGPKLRSGDRQVPEGLYRIESLNPNSRFHLSIRIDYPNAFDRARAQEERREDLGGDIMIHGAATSTGCLAIGDLGIEEPFVLVADVGPDNVSVILSPVDLRTETAPEPALASRPWVPELYGRIHHALSTLPPPTSEAHP